MIKKLKEQIIVFLNVFLLLDTLIFIFNRDARQLAETIAEQERISNIMQKQTETRLQRIEEAEKILNKEKVRLSF